ncbi:hypothetical protein Fcan01_19799 [Folsomia candida]|uniref:Uncharacterized protein n=1 Tax=Folsomia candida TaxID=158441 RepID=A0A226DKL1_FOLCA|nr:hypothetical protein Fcan01_19799 [Folsomia candida]
MDSFEYFVTLRSCDCVEEFPYNNASNFRNWLYKSIPLNPPQSYEIGLAEITLKTPKECPVPPKPPPPPPPKPTPKFFSKPEDGNIYLEFIPKDSYNFKKGELIFVQDLISQINAALAKDHLNVVIEIGAESTELYKTRIIYNVDNRELFLSPTLGQALGFTTLHFPVSGTYIGDQDIAVDDLKDLSPDTAFIISLGERTALTITTLEPDEYTLKSLLNAMTAAFKAVKLKIGIVEYPEQDMLRFIIISIDVEFKFSSYLSQLFDLPSDYLLNQRINDLFVPKYLFDLGPPPEPIPPPILRPIGQIWVHCDLSSQHLIGADSYNVIRIISPPYAMDQTVTLSFDHPRFYTVTRSQVSSVQIRLTDEYNRSLLEELVPTSVTLQIRRKFP